jgi:Zn-dependent peptidase ImmA (M78 family)
MGRRSSTQPVLPVNNQNQGVATTIVTKNPQYKSGLVFDVFSYANSIEDVEVRNEPLEDNISGYITREGDKFIITINSLQSSLRQRFTLAHELGHYCNHRDALEGQHTDVALFRDANEDRLGIEYAANDFAAELLMPETDFRKAIKEGQNTPKQLSHLFQVTEKAVLYRAFKLGIINSFQP